MTTIGAKSDATIAIRTFIANIMIIAIAMRKIICRIMMSWPVTKLRT